MRLWVLQCVIAAADGVEWQSKSVKTKFFYNCRSRPRVICEFLQSICSTGSSCAIARPRRISVSQLVQYSFSPCHFLYSRRALSCERKLAICLLFAKWWWVIPPRPAEWMVCAASRVNDRKVIRLRHGDKRRIRIKCLAEPLTLLAQLEMRSYLGNSRSTKKFIDNARHEPWNNTPSGKSDPEKLTPRLPRDCTRLDLVSESGTIQTG